MSFLIDLIDFIAAETGLVVDTNLFISEPPNSPDSFVVITTSGGWENESGLKVQAVSVISKDLTYLLAQESAYKIYDILHNKAGFEDLQSIFYCQAMSLPQCLDVDSRGRWVFTTDYYFRKK